MKQRVNLLITAISLVAVVLLVMLASCGQLAGSDESKVTVNLPYVSNANARALSTDVNSRLKSEHSFYRVHMNDRVIEGTSGKFTAYFAVGLKVDIFIESLNSKGEVIVRTVTKSIVVKNGENIVDLDLKTDGTKIDTENPVNPVTPPAPQPVPGKVTYNGNGADSGTPSDTQNYDAESEVTLQTGEPTRTGYTFAGWIADKDLKYTNPTNSQEETISQGTAFVSDSSSVQGVTDKIANFKMPDGGVVLTAKWTAQSYAITWNDVGNLTGQKTAYTIEDSYTLPTPTKTSSGVLPISFAGWYTEAAFVNKVTEIAKGSTGAKQFYAKWIEFTMVSVTGGTPFTMGDGSNSDNAAWSGVTVSNFKMGKYEVTQAQWEAVMGSLPSSMASADGDAGNNPVNYVSWYDALVFCNKLSMLENKTPCYKINNDTNPDNWGTVPTSTNTTWDAVVCDWDENGYRLPTEAEWEYAARGGSGQTHSKYSGVTTANPTEDDLKTVAWYSGNEGSKTHEVGTTPVKENALGISDMSGNVWEWCWDRYSGYASANGSTTSDPRGATTGSDRVRRGGSWYNGASYCTVAGRNYDYPFNRSSNYGLRLVTRLP